METAHQIFDRQALRIHRDRAARAFGSHDFLTREIGARLSDRLLDIARNFPLALDLGARTGGYGPIPGGPGGVERCALVEVVFEVRRSDRNGLARILSH